MNQIFELAQRVAGTSRETVKGWRNFNAVCCHHNGHKPDTRKRGGIKVSDSTITYRCFNCHYQTSYTIGRSLSYKFRKFLLWGGVSEQELRVLVIDALRDKTAFDDDEHDENAVDLTFTPTPLPPLSRSVEDWLADDIHKYRIPLDRVVKYITERDPGWTCHYMWTPDTSVILDMPHRVILPMTFNGTTLGYAARAVTETKLSKNLKYYNSFSDGAVFGLDRQLLMRQRQAVIVVEGQFDAIAIDGVAIMGSTIGDKQAALVELLGREIIAVPDPDAAGNNFVEAAVSNGWSVAFPSCINNGDDIASAVQKWGRLAVLIDIMSNTEHFATTIRLKAKLRYNRLQGKHER